MVKTAALNAPASPDATVAAGRAMLLLGAMVFVVALGYGAGLPLLQLFLRLYLDGATPSALAWHVGMLGGVYTFALFLFAPLWGRLSDRHGRSAVLAAGFAAFLIGGAAAALAPNLMVVYAARFLAGAGAASIVPTAQAYVDDISTPEVRSRRFVLLGSASFIGFLAGPAFGTWIAGPVMGMPVGRMLEMVNWPAFAIVLGGLPLLVLIPWGLGRKRATPERNLPPQLSPDRRRFVRASMGMALLASFAVGTFEVGFTLFGGQTLGLASGTMAVMFVTCSLAMLAAQSTLLLQGVRRRINERWVAAAFGTSALALTFAFAVPDAAALGLLIVVVSTGVGMVGPVLSYELLERHAAARGELLGRQAAAGNLGQALGSVSAGSLFAWQPAAPFWAAALILVLGAAIALASWGPARSGEVAAGLNVGS
ncbi:MFS transporter [Variovorax sp. JS1663]|uniref:MFS transporter n=1 Tax=Variovorax sp. JS1663 TaxID=1851577 RepID=UPI001EDFD0E5|nr:MFS transporter [Variovorax sp. JS1663]